MLVSKIAVFTAFNQPIHFEQVKIPHLKGKEILVRNEYATLCRSDLNTFCGKRLEKTPTILGHEIVGRIVAFGNEHKRIDERGQQLKIDSRISWAIYSSDPNDALSQKGIPQKAGDLFKYGHERITAISNLHGGLSEYTLLRPNTPVVSIEEAIPLPVASIINCAVATVAGSIRLAGNLNGKRILVSGAGMLGIIACAMSKALGAKMVMAIDISQERLQKAKWFGTDEVVLVQDNTNDWTEWHSSFDVVLEYSGTKNGMEATLQMLDTGGVAVWVGATHPQPNLNLSAEKVVRNLWTIKGLHNYNREDFVAAVAFIEEYYDKFPFEELIHDKFTLDQVNEAFEYGIDKNPFRVGINLNKNQ